MRVEHRGKTGKPLTVVDKYGTENLRKWICDLFGADAADEYLTMIAKRKRESSDGMYVLVQLAGTNTVPVQLAGISTAIST